MNSDLIVNIATVLAPAILAFLAGHYHIIPGLGGSAPKTPVTPLPAQPVVPPATPTPATPVAPVVPTVPATPALLPVGQGGVLQVLAILLQAIADHPNGTATDKNAASLALITAIQPLLNAPKS